MSPRYVRQSLQEQTGERWQRRIKASIPTAALIALLLWTLLHPSKAVPSIASQAPPIFVSLLPLPIPVEPPPERPPPRLKPPQREPRPDANAGGQPRGQTPAPKAKLALPSLPPPQIVPMDSTRAIDSIVMPAASPILTPLAGTDAAAGEHDLATGNGGTGSGMGNDVGGGNGDGTGSGAIVVVSNFKWVWKPTEETLRPFFPRTAMLRHVSGKTIIACRVRLSKRVEDCRIIAESADGFGFGSAAIAASRIFRIYPPRRNGAGIDNAWAKIPVQWDVKGRRRRNEDPSAAARGENSRTSANPVKDVADR